MQSSSSLLKLPGQLNLGTILPGQYGEILLPLRAPAVAFLTLELSRRAISSGFFLVREGSNDCKTNMSVVVKPATTLNIIVASYPEDVSKSASYTGELVVREESGLNHNIKLHYRVELPRILCKKLLENPMTGERMVRIIINKAVTSEGRIMLHNQEDYPLQLQPGLLMGSSQTSSDSPFLMKISSGVLQVEPKEQFMVFVSLATNIRFKQSFTGIKKCVLRNVLTLKSESSLLWCLPLEILVIFVKQPEMKEA